MPIKVSAACAQVTTQARLMYNVLEVSVSSFGECVRLLSTSVLVYYPSHVSASIMAVVTH